MPREQRPEIGVTGLELLAGEDSSAAWAARAPDTAAAVASTTRATRNRTAAPRTRPSYIAPRGWKKLFCISITSKTSTGAAVVVTGFLPGRNGSAVAAQVADLVEHPLRRRDQASSRTGLYGTGVRAGDSAGPARRGTRILRSRRGGDLRANAKSSTASVTTSSRLVRTASPARWRGPAGRPCAGPSPRIQCPRPRPAWPRRSAAATGTATHGDVAARARDMGLADRSAVAEVRVRCRGALDEQPVLDHDDRRAGRLPTGAIACRPGWGMTMARRTWARRSRFSASAPGRRTQATNPELGPHDESDFGGPAGDEPQFAWFISWSRQTPRKSAYISSTTGRQAVHRAHRQAHDRGFGEIGVSSTRPGYFSANPG